MHEAELPIACKAGRVQLPPSTASRRSLLGANVGGADWPMQPFRIGSFVKAGSAAARAAGANKGVCSVGAQIFHSFISQYSPDKVACSADDHFH
jgi:hypothetical protein